MCGNPAGPWPHRQHTPAAYAALAARVDRAANVLYLAALARNMGVPVAILR